jgi:hypothetical protein
VCPGTRFDSPEATRLVDLTDAHRQIRLLTARIIATERAAGMSADAIAAAERAVARHVSERRNSYGVECTDAVLLAFRLSALHLRLRAADEYRLARKMPRA